MSDIVPAPGLGLFVGRQDSYNDIVMAPPRPYLTRLDASLTSRAWYAGYQGVRAWMGTDLYLDFFVDPATKLMFAQPHTNESAARKRAWFAQDSEEWTFEDARKLSQWLGLFAKHLRPEVTRKKLVPRLPEFWCEYLDGKRADAGPLTLGLPREPDRKFENAGWVSWEDWSWEPPKARSTKA